MFVVRFDEPDLYCFRLLRLRWCRLLHRVRGFRWLEAGAEPQMIRMNQPRITEINASMASMTDENILVTKLWSDSIKNEFRIWFWIRFVICVMSDNIVLFNRHDRLLIDKTYSVYQICVPLNLEETIWRRFWSGGEVFGLWTHWWVRFRLVVRSIWILFSIMMHCIWWAIFCLMGQKITSQTACTNNSHLQLELSFGRRFNILAFE